MEAEEQSQAATAKQEDSAPLSAWAIVERMLEKDAFSKWLEIELVIAEPGFTKIKAKVTESMLNGFEIAHGGICYSLADSAMAFASNSHGQVAVSTNTSISHFKPVKAGDEITAEARETSRSERVAHYTVTLINQDEVLVASFTGTVYRTEKVWRGE